MTESESAAIEREEDFTGAPDSLAIRDIWLADTRAMNGLLNSGLKTLGDVRSAHDAELLRMPNFGKRTLAIVRAVIGSHDRPAPGNMAAERVALRAERDRIDARRREIGARLREIEAAMRAAAKAERHAAGEPARLAQQAKWLASRERKRAVVLAYLAGEPRYAVADRLGITPERAEKDRQEGLRRFLHSARSTKADPEIKAAAIAAGLDFDPDSETAYYYWDAPLASWRKRRKANPWDSVFDTPAEAGRAGQ